MRNSRLQLRNFRAFLELDITLEPATLLVGANDAGKSTIIDAISMVLATGHDIWEHEPGAADARGGVPWEQVVHRGGSVEDDARVFVSVTFDELSPVERDSWRAVLDTGAPLRLGRMWGTGESSGMLCVVLDRPHYLRLIENAGLGDEASDASTPGEKDAYRREAATIEDEFWCNFWWLGDMTATFETRLLGLLPEPGVNVIRIPGPEAAVPSPEAVLRPLIRSIVSRRASLPGPTDAEDPWSQPDHLGPLLGQLDDAASSAVDVVSEGFAMAVARLRGAEARAEVRRQRDHRSHIIRQVIDEVTGALEVSLDNYPIDLAGAGARRAALLAGLELYRDPDLWTRNDHVILMIEEPEVGLHPAAQHRVAKALATLHTFGLQTIVVSHSPVFVGAFPASSLRLARSVPGDPGARTVLLPEPLREVADELGVDPSDALLARRFVVVEGPTELRVFGAWARTLGLDDGKTGVRLVKAGGDSRVANVVQMLEVAYEGASFVAVLDGGKQTERSADEFRSRFGGRVEVRRLERDQIEKYYTQNAIEGWLAVNGALTDTERRHEVSTILDEGISKGALQHLANRYIGREYRVPEDGGDIARLMREADIAPELKALLLRLYGDE